MFDFYVGLVVMVLRIIGIVAFLGFSIPLIVRAFDEMFGEMKIPKEWKEADERREKQLEEQLGPNWRRKL